MKASVKQLDFSRGFNVVACLFLFVTLLLSGCVTTERGGIGTKVDDDQAVEDSVRLARAYIQRQNWGAAKRHLKIALEIDDSSAVVHEALGLVFQNTGEVEVAEQHYKKSIKLDNRLSRVRNNYAVFLYQQSRFKEAALQLERVVADTLYDKRAASYVNLGRSYLQLNELEKAEDAFTHAHLMDRRNVPLLFELAETYFQLEDFSNAQRFYDAYRSQVKQQPARALWLGIRLADTFNNKDALSSYVLALKNLYPTSNETLEYYRIYGKK